MNKETFIEVDNCAYSKHSRSVAGDVTLTRKVDDNRLISILCDGLGSGVEANVLANFTAAMGLEYMVDNIDITHTAELVMDALPLCPSRKISYSTFSIADLTLDCDVQIIEHGNPPFMVFKDSSSIEPKCKELHRSRWKNRTLNYARFKVDVGDRIIIMSDGVTQSGLGTTHWPMGFGVQRVRNLISVLINEEPLISASDLSRKICETALYNDGDLAGDDITCTVMYVRSPRILRVLTGPPVDEKRDAEFADLIKDWNGSCVICGGTTANIIEKILKKTVTMNLDSIDMVVPAFSSMEGVDLVTEGCITLSCCAKLLEEKGYKKSENRNGAVRLKELFLDNDIIEFYVGTRINQAHQDPDLPIELDIRRNTIKRIASVLEKQYLKKVVIRYF